jgi:geranylgeranyl diphosphate synthase type II
MAIEEYLKIKRGEIDKALEKCLPKEDAYPPKIHQAMRYSLLNGGKRIRPILTLAIPQVVGKKANPLMAACGVELIHTSSLILDDLPSMDNANFRRGRLATHKVFGEAVAILAAYGLLMKGLGLVAQNCRKAKIAKKAASQIIEDISEAIGSCGMIGGQTVDLDSKSADLKTLEFIHNHKTGNLFVIACETGARLCGASEKKREALRKYARNIGLAYQIRDDILDFKGKKELTGKDERKDINKLSFVTILGMEKARVRANELVRSSICSLKIFGPRGEFLRELAKYVVEREN